MLTCIYLYLFFSFFFHPFFFFVLISSQVVTAGRQVVSRVDKNSAGLGNLAECMEALAFRQTAGQKRTQGLSDAVADLRRDFPRGGNAATMRLREIDQISQVLHTFELQADQAQNTMNLAVAQWTSAQKKEAADKQELEKQVRMSGKALEEAQQRLAEHNEESKSSLSLSIESADLATDMYKHFEERRLAKKKELDQLIEANEENVAPNNEPDVRPPSVPGAEKTMTRV